MPLQQRGLHPASRRIRTVHSCLDVHLSVHDSIAVVTLHGAVDLSSAPLLSDTVIRAAESDATELRIDVTCLRFIDSSGLAVLEEAGRRFDTVVINGASGLVLRVLDAAAASPPLSTDGRRP